MFHGIDSIHWCSVLPMVVSHGEMCATRMRALRALMSGRGAGWPVAPSRPGGDCRGSPSQLEQALEPVLLRIFFRFLKLYAAERWRRRRFSSAVTATVG